MIEKILIFVIFLFPIILFHELGHFLFARLFGVRVEVFSIGFGPKLFKRKWKGTEYAISLIPLGGYVKMFGDDLLAKDKIPKKDRKKSFVYKGKWARFWIVFGGPLTNFLMAYFIYFALFIGGEKVPEMSFGVLSPSSEYSQMGIHSGDVLKAINNEEVLSVADISMEGEMVSSITVLRDGKDFRFDLKKQFTEFLQEFFAFSRYFRVPILFSQNGDKYGISIVEGKVDESLSLDALAEMDHIDKFYLYKVDSKNLESSPYTYDFNEKKYIQVSHKNAKQFFSHLAKEGFYPLDMAVSSIVNGSPADKVGIIKNDVIISLNGESVNRFDFLRSNIQIIAAENRDKPIHLQVIRKGKVILFDIIPEEREEGKEKIYAIGVYSAGEFQPLKYVNRPPAGFFESFVLAFNRTIGVIGKTFDGFIKLVTNQVSVKNIGGPIAIGKVAADSFHVSLSYFFSIMALISVNLGIINLFPVPVLDGGHIMFILMEIINRKPLSHRKMEIAQQIGLSLLLILIFLTLFNDISRLF